MTTHEQPSVRPTDDLAQPAPLDGRAYRPTRRTIVPIVMALASVLIVALLLAGYIVRQPGGLAGGGVLRAGQPAPSFALPDLDGRRVALADYRGRPAIVNFWATWCVPCRKEMPDLEAAARRYREQGLVVLAINVQEEPERVRAFLDELQLRELVPLLDANAAVVTRYQIVALPSTFFVDRRGQLRDSHVGQLDGSDLARKLERLLNEERS